MATLEVEQVPLGDYDEILEGLAAHDMHRTLMLRFTLEQRRPVDTVLRVRGAGGAAAVFVQTDVRDQCYFCTYGGGPDGTDAAAAGTALLRALPPTRERRFSGLLARDVALVCAHSAVPTIVSTPCLAWHCPRPDAGLDAAMARVDTARYTLRRLTAADAALVDAHWPHRGPHGAHAYIHALATRAPPTCAASFGGWGVADAAAGGALVAWGLQYENGALGFVHVEPAHRGAGLGRLVARRLTASALEQARADGLDVPPFVFTVASNALGCALYEHEGYVNDGPVQWVTTTGIAEGPED